jgi:hypothetical protein
MTVRQLESRGLAGRALPASGGMESVGTVVINYRNEHGQAVAEVLTFRDGLVCRGFGACGAESQGLRRRGGARCRVRG